MSGKVRRPAPRPPGEPKGAAEQARTLRADGRRNRERLIEAAKAAFGEVGADVSLEEIARRAGVGIGTLYRHFPTRDAIVEAVYRREVVHLAGAAARLIGSMPAGEALHQWMRLFVDYIATKKLIAAALGAIAGRGSDLYSFSAGLIADALALLLDRARAAGEIRPDVDPGDLLRALAGLTYGNADPGWQASALRLIDILMDGLRTPSARAALTPPGRDAPRSRA
ncbi:MAG: TetR/AcrR family transcriptional regulator [Hyphomicrobiales bacterium]|nr:TetR/AcrR family transcriptional regulator [Hyphomicrobiales bacterium]